MSNHDTGDTSWFKSSFSNANGDCVEMRRTGSSIELRDSKQQGAGPTLTFTVAEFQAWLQGANAGEYTAKLGL
jgi:hypothetical protein